MSFTQKHLLGIEGLAQSAILEILDKAEKYADLNLKTYKHVDVLAGLTQINMFFENSTRTQASFELAGKRLGADVMNMQLQGSSIKKGETLVDTALTLNAMRPDLLVVRHPHSGAVDLLDDNVPFSNGGQISGNWDLSTKRATSIIAILSENDAINLENLTAAGRSEYAPIATNETTEGKAKNRRIEVVLTPKLDEISKLLNTN